VHPAIATLRILWAAILTSTLILAGVLAFGVRGGEPMTEPVMLAALGAAALTLAVMSRVMFAALLRQGFAREAPRIEQAHDPHSAMAQYRGAAPTRRVFANRDQAIKNALRALHSATIVALAMSEAVGILGFVLGFLGFGWQKVAPFFVLSVALIASLFPSEKKAVSALERHHDAVMPDRS
jgi:hypothetical protein